MMARNVFMLRCVLFVSCHSFRRFFRSLLLVSCFLYIMPKEGEVSEDANAGSNGSFEDLRVYFDQKFFHLKRALGRSS